ncbi:hypothetical protein BOO69_15465 [Sulfitobacter alexandrii]|uniref:Uncharacterized protein n=1 Tax=Sulfitobacter alexandrii TaxID=1917485 RepID=A0A1J0WK02_9RHOB|nr:hypothetical protein [Sulfitobacter alexandrii]APE44652.1 hypothetical protein BOO69_15465 [Sulfitobacter alexandrii]
MLKAIQKTCIAAIAVTAVSLPLHQASAGSYSGPVKMAVRNDINNTGGVNVPRGYYPPAGSCRLWYPDRAATAQPAIGSCNVDVPLGAVLLLG